MLKLPRLQEIHTIIFDFDGVFTNNKVFVNEKGHETVVCDRRDGLAIDVLKSLIKKLELNLELIILSTEKNHTVIKRAEKLGLKCFYGEKDKVSRTLSYLKGRFGTVRGKTAWDGIFFLGNDVNDLELMRHVKYSACPRDSHPSIKKIAKYISKKNGGDTFVREVIEGILMMYGGNVFYGLK